MTGYGRLYGIGVGPGDPELLTLKAARILRQVPLVYVPQAETSAHSLALGIVEEHLDRDRQEIIRLYFPTNDEEAAAGVWQRAADMVVEKLKTGQDAAFLTEGDPMIYSTFSYLMENVACRSPEIPIEVVPGITSITAAAAAARQPLVAHGENLSIIPAAYGVDRLREAIASSDTVVLMKVNRALLDVLGQIDDLELAGKTVFVKRASTDREVVVRDLRQLSRDDLDYFSLLIIRNG